MSEDTYKEYLAKLQICDINYFKEYACKFEEYHIKAKIDPTDKVYLSLFFHKLPAPWGSRIAQKYSEIQHPEDFLGTRIAFAQWYLETECIVLNETRLMYKQTKKKQNLDCRKFSLIPNYGCNQYKYRKHKYKKKWKNHFKKYRNPYYSKKKYIRKDIINKLINHNVNVISVKKKDI